MDDLSALVSSVLADPADDGARLALADALDESGGCPGSGAWLRRWVGADRKAPRAVAVGAHGEAAVEFGVGFEVDLGAGRRAWAWTTGSPDMDAAGLGRLADRVGGWAVRFRTPGLALLCYPSARAAWAALLGHLCQRDGEG